MLLVQFTSTTNRLDLRIFRVFFCFDLRFALSASAPIDRCMARECPEPMQCEASLRNKGLAIFWTHLGAKEGGARRTAPYNTTEEVKRRSTPSPPKKTDCPENSSEEINHNHQPCPFVPRCIRPAGPGGHGHATAGGTDETADAIKSTDDQQINSDNGKGPRTATATKHKRSHDNNKANIYGINRNDLLQRRG